MINRLEGYTGDGFQERRAYINLQNDINRLNMNKEKIRKNDLKEEKKSEDSTLDNIQVVKPIIMNHYKSSFLKNNDNKNIVLNNNIKKNDIK